MMCNFRVIGTTVILVLAIGNVLQAGPITAYSQTNLVSDLPGVAPIQDPNLVNPWGIAASNTSPIWIADNGSGLTTVYNGAGQPFPPASPIVVTILPPSGGTPPSAPTGTVFNSTAGFGGSHFIFATEDGTIAAWSSGSSAPIMADNSSSGAVYKGLALDNNGVQDLLYATNFNSGAIDVFNSSFASVTLPGGFTDPNLPQGFAPFGIQNIGGMLYVTYAKQDAAKHDDVSGSGNGFVDVYNANGVLQERLISRGQLNSPWGLALAPAGFGTFSNDLLVGNFGDGSVNAFDPTSGAFLGTLSDANGNPIVNQGLWGLRFGNGAQGTTTDTLYLTAGIPGPGAVEDHGLFAKIQVAPEPATFLLTGGLLLGLASWRKLRAIH